MKKKAEIKSLKNRVEVLEFKEAAKGERFVLGAKKVDFIRAWQEVKWISEDGKSVVAAEVTLTCWDGVKVNGNYVEVLDAHGGVSEAYRVKDDCLVDMDVEVYRKAFYPEGKTEEKSYKTEESKVDGFEIGMRVVCVVEHDGNKSVVGKVGRVIGYKRSIKDGAPLVGVEFDEPVLGHNCDGRAKDDRGWWFRDAEKHLVKV